MYPRKPVYSITMRDIITETGWSQGAIYRYFKNVHYILFELIHDQQDHGRQKSPNPLRRKPAILHGPEIPHTNAVGEVQKAKSLAVLRMFR